MIGEFSEFINYLKKPRKPWKKIYYCHTRTSCRNTRHWFCFMRTYSGRSLCWHITEKTFRGMSFMVHWCLHWLTIVIMVLTYLMLWFIMEERCCCHYENIPIIMKDRLAFGKTCLYLHGSKPSFFGGTWDFMITRCLLQSDFWCYMLSLLFLWAWKRLRGSLELLWSSPTIHNNWKMTFFISK